MLDNYNLYSSDPSFVGGKVGKTTAAKETMVSVFSTPVDGVKRRVVIVVLGSDDYAADTSALHNWVEASIAHGEVVQPQTETDADHRKIPL